MATLNLPKRAIAVGVAILLAAVATFALLSYVRGVEAEVAEANEAVQAYVAKDVILQGTSGQDAVSQGLIVREDIPRRLIAEGAIGSLDQVSGRVAGADVLPGEQIVAARFVLPDDLSTELLDIPEDRQAMSIEVDVPSGVSQFIQRGSRVSLIAEIEATDQAVPAGDEAQPAAERDVRAKYLLQNLEVLAVGQRLVTTTTGEGEDQVQQTQDRVLLTLAVNPEEAEKLTLAIFEGRVYVTLLPPDQVPVETSGQTLDTIFE